MPNNSNIDKEMKDAILHGVFPSAQLIVSKHGKVVHEGYYGQTRGETHFDIASITKVVSTTTLAMQLNAEGLLNLNETVYDWLGGARQPVHKKMQVLHLLNHSSGLPRWRPFYREVPLDMVGTPQGKQYILDACYAEPVEEEPGVRSVYSDLDFIILGEMIEEAGSAPLDVLFANRIAKPLGLQNTFYVRFQGTIRGNKKQSAQVEKERRFAPTEDCAWREKIIRGEVHDQNAYAFGGVAGHAGLFSTARDINTFVTEIVRCYKGESDFIPQEIIKAFICFGHTHTLQKSEWLLGWDTPSPRASQGGKYFSKESIGHLGFTGCSLFIDLKQDFWVILLSNRIHPTDTNQKIKFFRPHIHDKIYEELIK